MLLFYLSVSIYYLTREAEKWLIDDLVVVDGEVDLEKNTSLQAEK